MSHTISLKYFLKPEKNRFLINSAVYLLDRFLGIRGLDKLYQREQLAGLSKEEFAKKLLEALDVKFLGLDSLQNEVPKEGPLVVASNHPFGGIEGVCLAWAIGQVRPDLKVLVNQGLKVVPELRDYFIFTNPLVENNPQNISSVRDALSHVKKGNALLMFPAGRVSYYRKDKKRVSEHQWNKIVGRMIKVPKVKFLPLFIEGRNSWKFYFLGRIYYRFRLLMLARELTNKKGGSFQVSTGKALPNEKFQSETSSQESAQLCRSLSYAQDPSWNMIWDSDQEIQNFKPLAPEISSERLNSELNQLPENQKLVKHKNFSVYFSYKNQTPGIVDEIARLREKVFRDHQEGSGEARDADHFDETYMHLYLVDHEQNKIAGAYRLGETDKLLRKYGKEGLYLNQMFDFQNIFCNQKAPCLEMGRSFLTPEYQKSFQGLYLLWKGIGALLVQFPKYRTLYGTVSISKDYDPRSVALIKHALVDAPQGVKERKTFQFNAHPEIIDFDSEFGLRKHLETFVSSIESDSKGLPVLVKHYMSLNAKFHSLGLDQEFNSTPGLLLSVDIPKIPSKTLKFYLGKGAQPYLDFSKTQSPNP